MAKKKKPEIDEETELDMAYTSITGYKPKRLRKKQKKAAIPLVILAVALLLIGIGIGGWYMAVYGTMFDGLLTMGDVTIAGIPMQGMTKKEATTLLSGTVEAVYLQKPVTVQVADTTLELTPAQAGLAPDAAGAVAAAYREGATGVFDFLPYLHLSESAVTDAVNALGQQYNTSLSHSEASVKGTQPSLADPDTAGDAGMILSVTLGSPQYGLDTNALRAQILNAYNTGTLCVTGAFSEIRPELPDLETLYQQTYVAPINAVMDGKTFEITPEVYGYAFDMEAVLDQLKSAEYGQTLEFSFQKIKPEVTAADLSATLFCDVLGSAETPYKGEDTDNRNINLDLACKAIDGVVLLPGETFSYNETLGKRTKDKGYKEAPAYEGGQTVDSLGGGICQISSTLYYSTLFADLEILERHNHSYVSSYIPKGMDATVDWGSLDLRFSNNTNYPIRIEASRANGTVSVRILGTDEKDYYVKMVSNVVRSIPYEILYEEMTADNEKKHWDGKVLVSPYTGYVVRVIKETYSKATDELISSETLRYDDYKKRDAVVVKIVESITTPEDSTEAPAE